MTSKNTLLILFFLILLPVLVLAKEGDYLFVSFDYKYADGSISNVTAEQRVADSSNLMVPSGNYTISLKNGVGYLQEIKFHIPIQRAIEVLGTEENQNASATPDYYSKTVAISLLGSLRTDELSIEIRDGSKILFNKKLSEIIFDVLSAKNSSIAITTPQPSFPPFPSDAAFSQGNLWLWIVLGIATLAVVGAGVYVFIRKSRNSQIQPPPAIPPTPPATPPVPPIV